MGSRREEERNEKIIRGLMKLPPNRRCINCNSLGPQYVCINFWTFVCMSCSGIHREFTHRVKSVSMSNFSSQEVEALQNGGNQRAREIYLKDWDQQRQRLPDSRNVDKVREFIKNVYVDKRYTGGKTGDKLPNDLQSIRSHEDDTRRASSYHSYSQSPPYDFQYEDRRYGKQAATLTRKPGSDKGLYAGKMASFICSPTRLSDRMSEDRFANEGSFSRHSDYSVSSGGDGARPCTESPHFQKDIRSTILPSQPSRETKRTASLGSAGSFDSNSLSLKSYNSGSFVDFVSENEQTAAPLQDKASTFPQSSAHLSHGRLDLFDTSVVSESNSCAAAPIDLFQLPTTSMASSIDLFQDPQVNAVSSTSTSQLSQASLTSFLDVTAGVVISEPQSDSSLDMKSSGSSVPKNEGWATFDFSHPTPSSSWIGNDASSFIHSAGGLSPEFGHVSSLNTNMQCTPIHNSIAPRSLASTPQHASLYNVQAKIDLENAHEWNAFDDSITQLPIQGQKQKSEQEVVAYKSLLATDQFFGSNLSEDFTEVGIQRAVYYDPTSAPPGSSDHMGTSSIPISPSMEQRQLHTDHRSTNPFDFPCDSELEPGNMFLDVNSLQAALPNAHLPPTYPVSVTESWLTQDPIMTYIPAAAHGSLAYMGGQAPSPQLTNVQAQGSVASVGGNPFA